jgi:hypothetical protein
MLGTVGDQGDILTDGPPISGPFGPAGVEAPPPSITFSASNDRVAISPTDLPVAEGDRAMKALRALLGGALAIALFAPIPMPPPGFIY